MPDIDETKLTVSITGVKNIAELKGKLNRIHLLTEELEKEIDSISNVSITFKNA